MLTVCLCVSADLDLGQDGYLEVVVAFVDLTHCWLRLIGQDYSVSLVCGVAWRLRHCHWDEDFWFECLFKK